SNREGDAIRSGPVHLTHPAPYGDTTPVAEGGPAPTPPPAYPCGGGVRGPVAQASCLWALSRQAVTVEAEEAAARETRPSGWTTVQRMPATSCPPRHGRRFMPHAPPGAPGAQQQVRPGRQA